MDQLFRYTPYIPYFIIAFGISFLSTPLLGYIATKFGIIDRPKSQSRSSERGVDTKIHKFATPKMGGLAVVIAFVLITVFILPITKQFVGLLLGVILLTIVGFLDDKYNIKPIYQLSAQIVAASLIVLTGTGIETINNPFGGDFNLVWNVFPLELGEVAYHFVFPSDILTILWIVLVINAMNWVSGIDGLSEGVTGIAAIIITLLSVRFFTDPTAIMGAVLAGAILGFLPFNFNPAKIFSGSIGDYVYGYLLAVLAIFSGAKFATAILLLGIPILDATWVIIRRITKSKPKNIKELIKAVTSGDKSHLHHRLLNLGLSVKQVAYVEYAMVTLLGLIAFLLTGILKGLALLFGLFLIQLFLIYTSFRVNKKKKTETYKNPKDPVSPEKKYAY